MILDKKFIKHYIDNFNANDEETVVQHIDNRSAWAWIENNVPFFECPNKFIEETYYFRWWVYRKHIKHTMDGFVITEFHPDVDWAGENNTINAATGHHLYEGRWLKRGKQYLDNYIQFWFNKGGNPRSYSTWLTDGIWNYCKVTGDFSVATSLLPKFVENYYAWEQSNQHSSGLFWSYDDRDAMEMSISGSGLRPTLNSYLYAEACAIARIANLAFDNNVEEEFLNKASVLKELINKRLWNGSDQFFKVIPLANKDELVCSWESQDIAPCHNVREQIGYIPWYFNIPDPGYENAWMQLMDTNGFYAPYGPTTAEQRHERFMFPHEHECLWNGPSWPFATSQTLTAMANLLRNYRQSSITTLDYYKLLNIYSKCHYLKKDDGRIVSWIDENLDPYSGEWRARSILKEWNWRADKGGYERGKDYNHSTYCDLIISGLVGINPESDGVVNVQPLIPPDTWKYFCIEGVPCHGKQLTVLYDETGEKYKKGKGLKILVDNVEYVSSKGLERHIIRL